MRRSSGRKLRYVFPFSLSAKPSRDWEDIFDDVWRSNRKRTVAPKAQAYLRKGELVIECALSEVNALFPGLRALVDSANEKNSEQLQQKAEKDKKKKRKRQEEKKAESRAIHEALEGLDFS